MTNETVDVGVHVRRFRTACVLTRDFLLSLAGRIETATAAVHLPGTLESEQIRLSTFSGYYSRAFACVDATTRLTEPSDILAITPMHRALFEGIVDLVLLEHESGRFNTQMLFEWERSAKLKHAEKVEQFFAGRQLGEGYGPIPVFLAGPEPQQIRASRAQWPKNRHPGRWTGRNLGEDAELADTHVPDLRLKEFYELEYGPACWNTHGSTLAGTRGSGEDFVPALWVGAVVGVLRFAPSIAQYALRALGCDCGAAFDTFWADARTRIEAIQ